MCTFGEKKSACHMAEIANFYRKSVPKKSKDY